MKRILRILTAIGLVCLLGLISYSLSGVAQTPQPKIDLTTVPPIAQVIPSKQLVQLTLVARDTNGNPLKNSKFQLQILTPPATPWFTTDFPIVEGTELVQLEAIAANGQLNLQQVFPIRGTYQIKAIVSPITGQEFAPIQQTLALTIPESGAKYRNLLLLTFLLLVAGWLGGRVIRIGQRHPIRIGEIAPQPVRLLLSGAIGVAIVALLVVNVSAELTEGHSHNHGQQHSGHHAEHQLSGAPTSQAQLDNQGVSLKLIADETAIVGRTANLAVQAIDSRTGQPAKDLLFQVKTTQVEEGELTFAYESSADASGKLVWQQQFFDGSPHRIEVEAMPLPGAASFAQPLKLSQTIEVEGVAPPLPTRFISLVYFLIPVGIGFALGFWQQKRYRPRPLLPV